MVHATHRLVQPFPLWVALQIKLYEAWDGHEAKSFKHVPPVRQGWWRQESCNQGNSNSISPSSTIFDSLARLDVWHQQPSLFLLPFQASSSSGLQCVIRCLPLQVLVSRITRSVSTFLFPKHSSLFCIFSAACLRKGTEGLGLSVISPSYAQITIKTLFLIGNSERALPRCLSSQENAVAWLLKQSRMILILHPTLLTPSLVSLRAIWNY
jgi:hypothetical protein